MVAGWHTPARVCADNTLMEVTRKQEQKPVIAMSKRRRFATISLALALVGGLMGGTVVLIDVWIRPDVVATTTAQSSVANAADTGGQTAP